MPTVVRFGSISHRTPEAQSTYQFTVAASDGDSVSGSQEVTVNVQDEQPGGFDPARFLEIDLSGLLTWSMRYRVSLITLSVMKLI